MYKGLARTHTNLGQLVNEPHERSRDEVESVVEGRSVVCLSQCDFCLAGLARRKKALKKKNPRP